MHLFLITTRIPLQLWLAAKRWFLSLPRRAMCSHTYIYCASSETWESVIFVSICRQGHHFWLWGNCYWCSVLTIFVIKKNKHLFSTNYQIHSVHTTFKTNLHPPIANLTKFQKGVYYSGIKIFNNVPHNIKDLANETKLFRNALKRFLLSNSFYNSEEYFNYQR